MVVMETLLVASGGQHVFVFGSLRTLPPLAAWRQVRIFIAAMDDLLLSSLGLLSNIEVLFLQLFDDRIRNKLRAIDVLLRPSGG